MTLLTGQELLGSRRRTYHVQVPDTTRGNPPVAEHFDATRTIVEFWRRHAGLP